MLQRFHIDVPMVAALVLLATIGLLVLYSASGESQDVVIRQSVRLAIGFVAMVVLAQVSPQQYQFWTPWVFALVLGLLVAVLVVGYVGKGAQRWISLAGVRFQPSELMKLVLPLMVASYLTHRMLPPRFRSVIVSLGLVAVPTALIANQPDLGTAIVVAASGCFALWFAGLSWRYVASFFALIAAFMPVLWYGMRDYQRQRVLTFLNPESDPLGTGYHTIQSKIAIGSGGTYGKGWLNGTQSQLEFLPERSTDFAFAVFSEEFGLLGVIGLLGLYTFIIVRGLVLASQSQELFGRLVGLSLVLTFFTYVFVNIGMVAGILPVVGLPLPMVSYGGTSMVTILAGFGIVMSVHSHRRLLSD
jgi:rod shape determining protein RodA